jgi:hypothetical protein
MAQPASIFLFPLSSIPGDGKEKSIAPKSIEVLFVNFIIKQKNKVEKYEEIFRKRINVGKPKEQYEMDKSSLNGLKNTLVTLFSEIKEKEVNEFSGIMETNTFQKLFSEIEEIIFEIIPKLEFTGDDNYSPGLIWKNLIKLKSTYQKTLKIANEKLPKS